MHTPNYPPSVDHLRALDGIIASAAEPGRLENHSPLSEKSL